MGPITFSFLLPKGCGSCLADIYKVLHNSVARRMLRAYKCGFQIEKASIVPCGRCITRDQVCG